MAETDETVLTQGTELFFVDTITTPGTPRLVKLNCPTGITGMGGGAPSQISTTCLGNKVGETSKPGLNQVASLSVPYNFKPTRISHRLLTKMQESKQVFHWMACLSDGVDPPELEADGTLTAPEGRTSIEFDAYVATNTLDIATNEIVRGTASLTQQAEGQVFHWNGGAVNNADLVPPPGP
ncbi:hypothetical protein ATCM_01055 [Stenotrophomonas sp. ATCM1_4]|uniref:phage tail tube protein n=1 Tax=Stenotrophomonas sp. ATCM1_4 TaxID=2259330 RepID=UPI0010462FBE|nr:phage tail tube protein [Stenotrophomonas sp. ATCM1_4]TDB26375.1 hypothetical protein ATCM_01055 [Stenotrophomonas sp. ATCM1_4]